MLPITETRGVVYSCISKGLKVDRLSPRISQDGNAFEDKERLWVLVSTELLSNLIFCTFQVKVTWCYYRQIFTDTLYC